MYFERGESIARCTLRPPSFSLVTESNIFTRYAVLERLFAPDGVFMMDHLTGLNPASLCTFNQSLHAACNEFRKNPKNPAESFRSAESFVNPAFTSSFSVVVDKILDKIIRVPAPEGMRNYNECDCGTTPPF